MLREQNGSSQTNSFGHWHSSLLHNFGVILVAHLVKLRMVVILPIAQVACVICYRSGGTSAELMIGALTSLVELGYRVTACLDLEALRQC